MWEWQPSRMQTQSGRYVCFYTWTLQTATYRRKMQQTAKQNHVILIILNWWKGKPSGSIACTRKQQPRFCWTFVHYFVLIIFHAYVVELSVKISRRVNRTWHIAVRPSSAYWEVLLVLILFPKIGTYALQLRKRWLTDCHQTLYKSAIILSKWRNTPVSLYH